ncbi:spore germination protein [Halalkalibacter sp. AB-rgal2]|uniref:spore germination protein n=1 Tax=Halalkalibacter sp. AB-rgal2 TaxID=3242695 RepID=UPI00359CEB3E
MKRKVKHKRQMYVKSNEELDLKVRELNEGDIYNLFTLSDDISITNLPFTFKKQEVDILFLYCKGLCQEEKINEEVIPQLENLGSEYEINQIDIHGVRQVWKNDAVKQPESVDEITSDVFDGKLFLWIELLKVGYVVDIGKHPQRDPEESSSELSIRGAKDGFIEEIRVNTALIRKRIRSTSLKYEEFTIGERSKTRVGLFYIIDIAPKQAIKEVRKQLKNIEIDGLLNTNQLEELLIPSGFRLFPMFHYTGRPDFGSDALLRGRFIILVDGAPTVLIAPVNLTFLIKAAEDNEVYFIYNSLERVIRFVGLLIAALLPGLWVALVAFHNNQLPFILVSSLSQVRLGVPLPTALEALIMVLIFELFREAGLRLPSAIGQILSVVGGLIIGDAAIRAGLTNPAMVVVVATSAVATFSLGNQSFAGTISVIRIIILILSSFLGLFGLFTATFAILLYAANIRSYGVPYLSPIAPYEGQDLIKAVFRPSWKIGRERPAILDLDDDRKSRS